MVTRSSEVKYASDNVINASSIYIFAPCIYLTPLKWRRNDRDGAWNHQPHHCLLKRYI